MERDLKVFILGPARSGTSIMYYAMREVFELAGRGEGHVFPIFQRLIHEFYQYSQQFSSTSGTLASSLDTKSMRKASSEYIRSFYQQIYQTEDWVDKTPGAEALGGVSLIQEVFPDARIIMMRRTGVEVVQSYISKFSASFEDACHAWTRCMIASEKARKQVGILEIDQFDLTNSPDAAAARIVEFLGRDSRKAILSDYLGKRRTDTHSTHDWSQRLTMNDVEWSDFEKELFVKICGEQMRLLGYEV